MRSLLIAYLLALLWVTSAYAAADKRTIELLNFDCRNDLGHRRVTFFANGTLRLISGPVAEESLKLAELTPDQVLAYENRLAEEDLSEVDRLETLSVSGIVVEHCELELKLWEGDGRIYRFARLDSLPLTLSRVVGIAEELAAIVESQAPLAEFPLSYSPEPGDILVREDGMKFEVVGLTGEGKGIELGQIDQPIIIYVPLEELRNMFVRVEPRGTLR
jgi:hypothetical protein